MSFRFRPLLNTLEGREVPASLSFVLSDGAAGSGHFATPAGVDAFQAFQRLVVDDLTVAVHGKTLTNADLLPDGGWDEDGTATADYQYGVLVGLKAEYRVPGTAHDLFTISGVSASSVGASWMPYPYPTGAATGGVALDGADTEVTFTLPGGVVGSISYQVPWAQVDPTQSSQSLTPTAFTINIAGQNIVSGFTTAPTLTFSNGDFVGINFAVNTSALVGFGFSSIALSGLNVTAVQAVTGTPQYTLADVTVGTPVGFINFAPLGTQANAYVLKVKFTAADGSKFEQSYNVGANNSAADVTALVVASIPKSQFFPRDASNPNIYVAGWNIKVNAAGTGFYVYSYRSTTERTNDVPKATSPYKSADVSATGATAQPSVIETQSGPK